MNGIGKVVRASELQCLFTGQLRPREVLVLFIGHVRPREVQVFVTGHRSGNPNLEAGDVFQNHLIQ